VLAMEVGFKNIIFLTITPAPTPSFSRPKCCRSYKTSRMGATSPNATTSDGTPNQTNTEPSAPSTTSCKLLWGFFFH
jgi:hypothetical protein